jgi:hypothetical protein
MKKLITLCIMLASAVALVTAVSVEANNPSVSYTFMLTDLEQGAGGGGSLFADGSAGGHLVVSVLNGQVIAHFYPESWSEVVPGESVDICFNTHQTKGPVIFPPYFCTSDLGIYVPVSGMPVLITNPHGGVNTLIKVTPTG